MTKFAKVNKNSGLVESVSDYTTTPQVPDHERQNSEYVQVKEGQDVKVGHPLPDEAKQGHQGDPGHQGQGQGQGQAQAPGQQQPSQQPAQPKK